MSSAAGVDVDARGLVVADEKGHIHLFSRNGSSVWRQEKLAGRGLSAPILVSSHVLIGDSEGVIHLLRRDDGALLARVELGRPVSGAAVKLDALVVVQTVGGALHALAFE
jgi:outer membrane protein assembly factor BamB